MAQDGEVGRCTFQRLQENISRLTGSDAASVLPLEKVADASPFEVVWVDAPCTGSGILRRHPDVRWSKGERDLQSLQAMQLDLLKRGAGYTRKDGFLVYSVCSVFSEEGPDQVRRFCKEQGWKVAKEWLLSPHIQGGDGFYGAVLTK